MTTARGASGRREAAGHPVAAMPRGCVPRRFLTSHARGDRATRPPLIKQSHRCVRAPARL